MAESKITKRFTELRRAAETTGEPQAHDLSRGARIGVRIREGQLEVCFSRTRTPLGDEELKTFYKHCQVPDGAERVPETGQKSAKEGRSTRHYVIYRWPITAALPGFEEHER
jgi:hypothetical protein